MHHHIANKTSIHSFNPADPKYAWHAAPPIQLWESISEKTFLLDVLVTLNDYSLINLEMQVINAQPAGTLLKLSLPNFLIWYNSRQI